MKLTAKQKEIISKMQQGYILLVGRSEDTGSIYQYVSKGFDNVYFRADTFDHLLQKGFIYNDNISGEWGLTDYGKTYKL